MTPNNTSVNFDPLNPTDWEKSTYYSRDAQGNVMAIYEYTVDDNTQQNHYTLTERNIYGSNRLGNNNKPVEMIAAPPVDTSKYVHYVGNKQYELSNHLGNVMAVISDRKIARDTSANDTVDYYEPDVLLTFDYSPFGAPLHARSFSKEVCHDTTFTMTQEDLNTNFDDGTTMGWIPLSSSTSMNATGGTLNLKKQGGSGTVGATQSFTAISGEDYDFTITVSNPCNNSTVIVLELLDANNSIIYTQSVGSGVTTTFNYQFTAAVGGVYTIKVYRTGNNSASCIYYIDDVLVTHQKDVNQQICFDYGDYRWGFSKSEKDNKVSGIGYHLDYGARGRDPRLGGGWWSMDPFHSNYSGWSPYNYGLNNPIYFIDVDGNVIYDKNGKEVVIEYRDDGGIIIVNESSIDANTAEVIKKTYSFSSIGATTIKELDAKGVKHQVYVTEKHGIFKEKGKYGNAAGLTINANYTNEEGKEVFLDEEGNEYDSRVLLFNTEEEELSKDNIIYIDDYGLVGSEKETNKAAEKIAKKGLELNRETHKTTAEGIDKISPADAKILDKIDNLSKLTKFFGWLTTLVHENVHAQGDPTEDKSYQTEIDSFKEANEK